MCRQQLQHCLPSLQEMRPSLVVYMGLSGVEFVQSSLLVLVASMEEWFDEAVPTEYERCPNPSIRCHV